MKKAKMKKPIEDALLEMIGDRLYEIARDLTGKNGMGWACKPDGYDKRKGNINNDK